ncbi:hypothetical protein KI387_028184, partial [Taxus chinensis]
MKNDLLKIYKDMLWYIIKDFEAFNINSIQRNKNKAADRIATIGATFDIVEDIKKGKAQPHIKVVVRPAVLDNNT